MSKVIFIKTCGLFSDIPGSEVFKMTKWDSMIIKANDPNLKEKVAKFKPDFIVLDIFYTKVDCFQLARNLRNEFKEIILLAYTSEENDEYTLDFYHNLVDGITFFQNGFGKLVRVLKALKEGTYKFKVCEEKGIRNSIPRPVLAVKEIEFIKLVVKGFNNSEIAVKIGKALRTVGVNKKKIERKMGAGNFYQVVALAIFLGYITIRDVLPIRKKKKK